ncbi:unnamed protein product [Anisakis simplex]|uniref:DUF3707 domain-containing protein n=1 Tax=Anisakis simplex TaxID=6269 RepID=A0A0M3JFB0_ANISI|nr:unnamed protein product [Anisakis simplex]
MVLCRARHGYVFCEKLAKGCSRLAKVTISSSLSGLTINFPEIVVTCIREEPYLPQLVVEYGFTKIEAWMTLCKITVWNGPITVVQKECVVKQTRLPDARSQCIKKYGADFCSTLITSCFEVTNTEFLGEKPCAVCELPAKVYVCLQKGILLPH